jgi:hypothetical protein
MSRIKSLLIRVEIDEAGKAHNCQANAAHRIVKGEKRLSIRKGRSWEHYCLACGRNIAQYNLRRLEELSKQLET